MKKQVIIGSRPIVVRMRWLYYIWCMLVGHKPMVKVRERHTTIVCLRCGTQWANYDEYARENEYGYGGADTGHGVV